MKSTIRDVLPGRNSGPEESSRSPGLRHAGPPPGRQIASPFDDPAVVWHPDGQTAGMTPTPAIYTTQRERRTRPASREPAGPARTRGRANRSLFGLKLHCASKYAAIVPYRRPKPPVERDNDPLALPDNSVPYDGVPPHLDKPLRQWVLGIIGARGVFDELADTPAAKGVALRLRLDSGGRKYVEAVLSVPPTELLKVVNATLQLVPEATRDWRVLSELEEILVYGGSAYMLDGNSKQLIRRVEETAIAAHDRATRSTSQEASGHLKAAWLSAYGIEPDPDQAYDEAVRAVEASACPIICPKSDGRRTLGTAIAVLKNDLNSKSPKWSLALPKVNGDPADLGKVIAMLDLLWKVRYRGTLAVQSLVGKLSLDPPMNVGLPARLT